MDSEFANDIPSEGNVLENAFERLESKEDKTASDSQPEKNETAKPSQEGENTPDAKPEPFHKHPRWVKTQQELKETREEIARLKSEREQSVKAVLPDWYKAKFGETEDSIKNYSEIVKKGGELEWIKQQVKDEFQQERQAEEAQKQQADEYVNTQLAEMSEEGLKFERNKLLNFMVEFQKKYGAGSLLDTEGNYDFRKGLDLMNDMQPEEVGNDVHKQAAAQAGRSKAASQRDSSIPTLSRHTLRRGNWRDAETGQFISK